jgi:hypothetical protein
MSFFEKAQQVVLKEIGRNKETWCITVLVES